MSNSAQQPPHTPLERFAGLTSELLWLSLSAGAGLLLIFVLGFAGLLPMDPEQASPGAILAGPLLIGTAGFAYSRIERLRDEGHPPLAPFGSKRGGGGKQPSDIPGGLMIAAAAILAATAGSMLLSLLQKFALSTEVEEQATILDLVRRGDPIELTLLAVSAVILAPITEELLFRGMFFRRLHQHVGPIAAWTLPALAFALSHGNFVGLAVYFWLGSVFAVAYAYSGRLWVAMLAHAGHNGFALAMLLIAPEAIPS